MNAPPVLIAKRPSDNAELLCIPDMPISDNGIIRLRDGSVSSCSVMVALAKMPFFLFDPAKVTEPYRREVIERIQSGEAIKDWMSGTGLKIATPMPQPAPKADDKKSSAKSTEKDSKNK